MIFLPVDFFPSNFCSHSSKGSGALGVDDFIVVEVRGDGGAMWFLRADPKLGVPDDETKFNWLLNC